MSKQSNATAKAKKAEYERKRYAQNKAKILAQQADYYKDNKNEIQKKHRDYMDDYNKLSSTKKRKAKWQDDNRKTVYGYITKYRKQHPDPLRKTQTKYDKKRRRK